VEDFSELGRRLQDPVNTYSSGMRAKLSFGVSLGVEFDCYLIDEVVAVGDKRFRRKCREELEEKRHDRAMLMVSHQPNNIKQFCDTAILLEQGRYVDSFDVKSGTEWRKHAQPRPDG
ncbi:MAG TPA: hypothetical protein VHE81_00415, partial [Lacipirellulaceae bacterium]|nr:hypothetical protein [Lacipirellulaceae bacterium]